MKRDIIFEGRKTMKMTSLLAALCLTASLGSVASAQGRQIPQLHDLRDPGTGNSSQPRQVRIILQRASRSIPSNPAFISRVIRGRRPAVCDAAGSSSDGGNCFTTASFSTRIRNS
jgi:hypothetical protein